MGFLPHFVEYLLPSLRFLGLFVVLNFFSHAPLFCVDETISWMYPPDGFMIFAVYFGLPSRFSLEESPGIVTFIIFMHFLVTSTLQYQLSSGSELFGGQDFFLILTAA
ncbi:hypothetical protein SAY86_014901 [Trapa natans]|uniref:Uncharacterized protein n=1 Tax=Trapa natans TaxID=22666 RepID=A0AAN7KN72_TRANT|nr:hypothetical protein SAY86_014901 [Trapa natans]